MGAVETVLRLIPGAKVETIESQLLRHGRRFGYQAETIDVSRAMAELVAAARRAQGAADTIIVADGTSCRHQIADGSARKAEHVARVLARHLA